MALVNMIDESNYLAVERQKAIIEILKQDGIVRTSTLRELFSVSAVTVRSDLRELEQSGYCEVIWGGAVFKQMPDERPLYRAQSHLEEKERIGARTAQMIEEGQTVIVDAGTTMVQLIKHLSRDLGCLRIVTPSLDVAAAASHFPNVELIVTGGILRHLTGFLVGNQTAQFLETIYADTIFLSAGAFSAEHGITGSNTLEVEAKRVMLARSDRAVLLADSSKFNKRLALTVAALHQINTLVTDTGLSETDTHTIKALGVDVLRV